MKQTYSQMIPGRLAHNEPKLNIKEFWYVAIAEGPEHYLVEIHSNAGCINGQIRSAKKSDYHFVDAPVEKAIEKPSDDLF